METPRRADADDTASIDKLQAAADAAATQVGQLSATFLLFGVYLAITVGATTHEQLLRAAPVTLPLLNAQIPLFGFYWIAPALFVLMHFYLIMQFYLLAHQLRTLDRAFERLPGVERNSYRVRLQAFAFSHMLIGRHHSGLIRFLFRLMVWITMIILPIVLLLDVQVRFLPYHDAATTTAHRLLLLLDLLILLFIWPQVVQRSTYPDRRPLSGQFARCRFEDAIVVLAVMMGLSSVLVLTFPGDPMEDLSAAIFPTSWRISRDQQPETFGCGSGMRSPTFSLTAALFNDFQFLRRNLVVLQANMVTTWPSTEQIERFGEDLAWRNFGTTIDLSDRDLRYACLFRSSLAHANLQRAKLLGAALKDVNLQGADLESTELKGASLDDANLQGAMLFESDLQGATLTYARLQGAWLRSAKLQGADLTGASLQGAILRGAYLQRATLEGASLQGAVLADASLHYAQLRTADLRDADLSNAKIWRTDLPDRAAAWSNADLSELRFDPAPREPLAWLQKWRSSFPAEWRGTMEWHVTPNVFFDPRAPYALDWSPPPSPQHYGSALAEDLKTLACLNQNVSALAEGIARRLVEEETRTEDLERQGQRSYRARIAAALLASDCLPAKELPDWYRRRFEAILRYQPISDKE